MAKMAKLKPMTKRDVETCLRGLSKEQRKPVACGLIGHSRLRTGWNYCARCNAQLCDSIGGAWMVEDEVLEGHDGTQHGCTCRKNYDKLTWRDKYLVEAAQTWDEWMVRRKPVE